MRATYLSLFFFVKTVANIIWKALDENSNSSLFHLSGHIRSNCHRVKKKWFWGFQESGMVLEVDI